MVQTASPYGDPALGEGLGATYPRSPSREASQSSIQQRSVETLTEAHANDRGAAQHGALIPRLPELQQVAERDRGTDNQRVECILDLDVIVAVNRFRHRVDY